ncbi:ChbG/HpnK family deacetylase [Roseicella aquatilis]|uniref:ChbG/HpnK family deacetylase n=2 Tax=Roseicella aquatilis TaxID=2527868 RepID=A0A4R4D9P3_9PROT|nr:ChbG/HpnK family deacetylase [Roseicella aquatilis]
MPRPVVLCADDYALTEGVSRGILDLAQRGRISATGVMANMPGWPRLAAPLRGLGRGTVGIGLHMNLTTGAPLGRMPGLAPAGRLPGLRHLLRRVLPASGAARAAMEAELAAEIARQLDTFEQAHGAAPDFVDGHQHVHALPVVRRALLRVLADRYPAGGARPWLRDPSEGIGAILARGVSADKALVVAALSTGFRRAARAAGFDLNRGFSGFSPLNATTSAARVLERALLRPGPRHLVMCHPGHADEALRALDPAVESRPAELAYLASTAFADLLASRRVILVPRP